MVRNSDNKSRVDYHTEQNVDVYEKMVMEHDFNDDPMQRAKESARNIVRREDELIWAFHRDPTTDLNQIEARDRAQTTDYPERYNLSQSSISRKLSKLDDDMLTEPVEILRMQEREGPDQMAGFLGPMQLETMQKNGFIDVLDVYRGQLARFIVDTVALDRFMDGERVTPAWARDRFPSLNPDLGRKYYARSMDVDESNLHPPDSEVTGEITGAAGD